MKPTKQFIENLHSRGSCQAWELEIGAEFSYDEGRTWMVVRTEPRYLSEDDECLTLKIMCSPKDSTSLGDWEEVQLGDKVNVLLDSEWKSK